MIDLYIALYGKLYHHNQYFNLQKVLIWYQNMDIGIELKVKHRKMCRHMWVIQKRPVIDHMW